MMNISSNDSKLSIKLVEIEYILSASFVSGATRVAAMFPVVSLVMIIMAVILGIIGNIRKDIKTLLAAVISILGGNF